MSMIRMYEKHDYVPCCRCNVLQKHEDLERANGLLVCKDTDRCHRWAKQRLAQAEKSLELLAWSPPVSA